MKTNNAKFNDIMKKLILLLAATILLTQLGFSQNLPLDRPSAKPQIPQIPEQRFDLDFPGGGPQALVSAIEKATGQPLNVLVPDQCRDEKLPAMELKGVTVPDLFAALARALLKNVQITTYPGQTQNSIAGPGFNKDLNSSVWYFSCYRPPAPQQSCRFYQLADLLQDSKVEDITTAIQTGWKLIGVQPTPQLKFHPETKLLIAMGKQEELAIIDSVLSELRKAAVPKKDGTPTKQ